jgi:peptidoglycan/LPS O-acetylase OafA/YrhL
MVKIILLNLVKTFLLSLAVSTAISCVYYATVEKGNDYGKAIPVIISAQFYLNGILLIMAASALFTPNPSIWSNPAWRLFLFFAGPLAFIITNFVNPQPGAGNTIYIISGVVFLITHAVFYYKLTKKISTK